MRLIDADALKAEIQRRRKRYKTLTGVDMAMLIDDAPTVGGWISVKDRLPDAAGYECLVCAVNENTHQTHVFTAFTGYGEPGWWTSNVGYMSRAKSPCDNRLHPALRVTHWTPLPEPPEVEA